ncbi:NACHT domain-containing protein [Capilliphycus salinus ALCB114379]|uniref:NACHT domain-containing protein n=1 Tax=Capilliphycus salinus TaxID=2768948 RepID=UPI0039A533D0
MEIKDVICFVEKLLNRELKDIEKNILEITWNQQKLSEINNYSKKSVNKPASQLWKDITDVLGEKVKKINVKEILENRWNREREKVEAPLGFQEEQTENQHSKSVNNLTNNEENDYDKLLREQYQQCEKVSALRRFKADVFKIVPIDDFFVDIYFQDRENSKDREIEEVKLIKWQEIVLQESKLLIRGEPGSGKSMLLKFIVTHINQLDPNQSLIPILIELKEFYNLKNKLKNQDQSFTLEYFISYKYFNINEDNSVVQTIKQGKALILLDQLDELSRQELYHFFNVVLDFDILRNRVILSCRSGYGLPSKKLYDKEFKIVHLSPFNNDYKQGFQIQNYAYNWLTKIDNRPEEVARHYVEDLLRYIEYPENERIQEIVGIPLLLNLILIIFVEKGELPSKKSDLYRKAIDCLVGSDKDSWNYLSDRDNLEGDINFEILLREIAATAFKQGNSSFSVEDRNIHQLIKRCVPSFSNIRDLDQCRAKLKKLLNDIEVDSRLLIGQGEKYSFYHSTFQEYFTARHFLNKIDESDYSNRAFENLTQYLSDSRWREVFLLLSEMLQPVDNLIIAMKNRIDEMPEISEDSYIQSFLGQLNEKSKISSTPFVCARSRAFYLASFLDLDLSRDDAKWYIHQLDIGYEIDPHNGTLRYINDLYSLGSLWFQSEYGFNGSIFEVFNYIQSSFRNPQWTLSISQKMNFDIFQHLQESLKLLKQEIKPTENESLKEWWQREGDQLHKQLKEILDRYRVMCQSHIGNYKFSVQQREALKLYYDANQLLLDCLQRGYPDVSLDPEESKIYPEDANKIKWKELKNGIESTLLLPKVELEKLQVTNDSMSGN